MRRFVLPALLAVACCVDRPVMPANGRRIEVNIQPGTSLGAIADTLHARGIIRNRFIFKLRSRLKNYEHRIVPGRYRLAPGSDGRRVLRVLTREEPALLMITIPEGYTSRQVAEVLAAQGICNASSFLAACSDAATLRAAGIDANSAEGHLFPETYEISTAELPGEIVGRMTRQYRNVVSELRAQATSRLSDHELATLASIVEKEAMAPAEFSRIAGVFANRLKRGLPLQSCASVEYVLPERRARLSVKDTKVESPYNTYLHAGLPPGPICNPGRRALEASLSPERHDYLYFVARGDGTHIFSRTLAEHGAAKRRLSRSG